MATDSYVKRMAINVYRGYFVRVPSGLMVVQRVFRTGDRMILSGHDFDTRKALKVSYHIHESVDVLGRD